MNNNKNFLFFLSHQPNPRFVKQINFLSKYFNVSLVFFHRNSLMNINDSINKDIDVVNLGVIPNLSSPFKRVLKYITTFEELKKRSEKDTFDFVLVNNIDVLLLFVLSNLLKKNQKKRKLIVEISDLREYVFKKSITSKLLKIVEKKIYLRYVDKLIVTSEKYYTYHFKKFFKKEIFVLENKLIEDEIKKDISQKKEEKGVVKIGIVGLLLRKKEYIELFETYKGKRDYEIVIYGTGEFKDLIKAYSNKYKNIKYFGPYNTFNDSHRIYNSIDILYLVYDTNEVINNNSLALPNKLYESMYYQVPILCSKNTYLEELVTELNIGVAINYKNEGELEYGINELVRNKDVIKSSFMKIPKKRFFGDYDYLKLIEYIKK